MPQSIVVLTIPLNGFVPPEHAVDYNVEVRIRTAIAALVGTLLAIQAHAATEAADSARIPPMERADSGERI